MTRSVDILLSEILGAIALLRGYTADLDFEEFMGNVKKQDVVMRRLEIMGEAVKGVPGPSRQLTLMCLGATSPERETSWFTSISPSILKWPGTWSRRIFPC